MIEYPDPDAWQSLSDSSDAPSFRFSQFFKETCDQVPSKIAGDWFATLDRDTVKDFCETFLAIDQAGQSDNVDSDHPTRKDLADLLYLTILIWQWETGKIWDIKNADLNMMHCHVEYLYRLARLAQFEYLKRVGEKSPDEILERDDAQHHGRLSIFD
jgi:hypothetical protein